MGAWRSGAGRPFSLEFSRNEFPAGIFPQQTYCRWKKNYALMGAVELRGLKQLEQQNGKIKQLLAILTLSPP